MEDFSPDSQIHGYSLRGTALVLLFTFLFQVSSFGQQLSTDSKKAAKFYQKADKQYRERDFVGAIDLLESATSEDPNFAEAYLRMGSLYTTLGEIDSAYSKFRSYVRVSPKPMASILERLAQDSFDRGEYASSQDFLEKFLLVVPEKRTDPTIDLLMQSLRFATDQLQDEEPEIQIEELSSGVNQFPFQYLPSITIDQNTIFFTKRDHVQGDEDIVFSRFDGDDWKPAQSMSKKINTPFNEGACTVSADGRTMIFTSCEGRNTIGSCDLYFSELKGNDWIVPQNLGKPVNSVYWESQPSLSADGKTLYFSSNRKGGVGGRDIWVSKKTDDGWSEPLNLGTEVNTPRDETTPFIHPNGKSLYFSANGYPGMGGYDLYVSSRSNGDWTKPQNLGYPINTFRDEVSIVISGDGRTAYFAKEEKKNLEITSSKIVSFQLPESTIAASASYIIGKVTDSNSGQPLSAIIEVFDVSDNTQQYMNQSDSVTGEYLMVLPSGLSLSGYVRKKGYLFSEFRFDSDSNQLQQPDTIDIQLEPVQTGGKIILKNLYFDIDSYVLDDKSAIELKSLVRLFEENEDILVEIAGHADGTGINTYNQNLSEMRAKEVYSRLVNLGVDPKQLTFSGYGSSQPIATNETPAGRESNRRIEFRVLRKKL